MRRKALLYISIAVILVLFSGILLFYRIFYGMTINPGEKRVILYIPDNSYYKEVLDTLYRRLEIDHPKTFEWLAEKKHYPGMVKPGRYVIDHEMTYTALINLLRSGRQSPVNVTFNNIRTLNELAGKIGKQISADSLGIIGYLSEPDNFTKDGFTRENLISLFIPNTYQFFWNTSAKGFYSRMLKEYNKFWNDDRKAKARAENLTQVQVAILASIIDDEVSKSDEKPRIAGVYLNRLRRGMPLQACPTIKFALNDWTITRVLKAYLQVESPYNTYRHTGFPPGPIGCPTIEGLDAVLNAEKHDYLYFAAKADFSGYHNFSRTLSEHNRYAAEYQRELNRRKIYR